MVINSEVPFAETNVLVCHKGRLYAAGDDQVVRSWKLKDGAIDQATLRTYRWPAWREERGSIRALAVSKDGKRLAIGGNGLQVGLVVELSIQSGAMLRSTGNNNFHGEVRALTYLASGELLIGSALGQIGVFPSYESKDWREIRSPMATKKTLSRRVLALFSDSKRFCLAAFGDGSVERIHFESKQRVTIRQAPPGTLFAYKAYFWERQSKLFFGTIERSSTSYSASLFQLGNRGEIEQSLFRKDFATATRHAAALSLDVMNNGERLLIASAEIEQLEFPLVERGKVWLFDVETGKEVSAQSYDMKLTATKFTGEGAIAVAGGAPFFIETRALPKLDVVTSRLKQQGMPIRGVELVDKAQIRWQTRQQSERPGLDRLSRGPTHAFSLSSFRLAQPENTELSPPVVSLNGWQLRPAVGKFIDPHFVVQHESGRSWEIKINPLRWGKINAAILVPSKGKKKRVALAHRWGVSIFEFDLNTPPKRARLMIGHQGETLSLACQGDILVSGGADGTIACFSLADWPNHPELGVSFRQDEGDILVGEVAIGSPGWSAGLTANDRIAELYVNGKRVVDPSRWSKALASRIEPGEVFAVKCGEKYSKTTLKQRPIWKMYITGKEWVIWRWQDYFYECSVLGDRFIGWQINDGLDRSPRYVRAEQNRRQFHRPDKLRDLFSGKLVDPVKVAESQLVAPRVGLTVIPKGEKYLATVQLINPDDEVGILGEPAELSLWLDDHRLTKWQNPKSPYSKEFEIDKAMLRKGTNRLIARAYTKRDVRGDSTSVNINKAEEAERRLFCLSVGINAYKHSPLQYAGRDAFAFSSLMDGQIGYPISKAKTLLNHAATRSEIKDYLRAAKKQLKPDDLLVFFFAGHGIVGKDANKNVVPSSLTLVTVDSQTKNIYKTGIPFARGSAQVNGGMNVYTLFDALAEMRCRKLVVLDSCHSGAASEFIRNLTPDLAVGPTIMVAAQGNESAKELSGHAHGAYTESLIRGLTDEFLQCDQNNDDNISLLEWHEFSCSQINKLLADEARLTGKHQQTPTLFLGSRETNLPLFNRVKRPTEFPAEL